MAPVDARRGKHDARPFPSMEPVMKRVLLAVLLLGAAVRAYAVDWTDIWNNPAQPNYGYNLVQSDNFIFVTFYVYGPSGAPIWLVAGLTLDAAGNYTGNLYAANGTFFGAPWNAAAYADRQVGTALFQPSAANNYQGTISYTSTDAQVGVGSSTVAIERQTLTAIPTGGDYVGGQTGAYTGCTAEAHNFGYTDKFDLTVTHLAGGGATFVFSYISGLTCTLAGTYVQHGQYYDIPSASYECNDGLSTTAAMSEIKPTSLGIEGRYAAPNAGGGCAENANFAAVWVR
jgi:hypothetical protein